MRWRKLGLVYAPYGVQSVGQAICPFADAGAN